MKIMKLVLLSLMVVVIASGCFGGKDDFRRPPREKWSSVVIKAEVVELDVENRLATLKGPSGNLVTVEVGEDVRRLDEVEVGDMVKAEYWSYLLAEFRDPTEEEKKEPLVVLADGGRVSEEFPPGVVLGAVVKAVVTVVNINSSMREVTVKGPKGNYVTVPDVDSKLLKKLKIGEVGIVVYSQAVALSLEKLN